MLQKQSILLECNNKDAMSLLEEMTVKDIKIIVKQLQYGTIIQSKLYCIDPLDLQKHYHKTGFTRLFQKYKTVILQLHNQLTPFCI